MYFFELKAVSSQWFRSMLHTQVGFLAQQVTDSVTCCAKKPTWVCKIL